MANASSRGIQRVIRLAKNCKGFPRDSIYIGGFMLRIRVGVRVNKLLEKRREKTFVFKVVVAYWKVKTPCHAHGECIN